MLQYRANKLCFQKSAEAVSGYTRISQIVRQWVPNRRASNRESPSAVRLLPVSRKNQESSTGGPEVLCAVILERYTVNSIQRIDLILKSSVYRLDTMTARESCMLHNRLYIKWVSGSVINVQRLSTISDDKSATKYSQIWIYTYIVIFTDYIYIYIHTQNKYCIILPVQCT